MYFKYRFWTTKYCQAQYHNQSLQKQSTVSCPCCLWKQREWCLSSVFFLGVIQKEVLVTILYPKQCWVHLWLFYWFSCSPSHSIFFSFQLYQPSIYLHLLLQHQIQHIFSSMFTTATSSFNTFFFCIPVLNADKFVPFHLTLNTHFIF